MFNECHIHLCDCTWLNVFSHAQSLLIKHKKIFKCFSCIWKVFCLYKNVKNYIKKTCFVLFWRLSRALIQSHAPVTSLHRNFSQLTGGLMSQSWKILGIFLKFVFLMFLTAQFGDLFVGGGFSREGTQRFSRLTRDSFAGRTSSRENHLEIFFL